MEPGSSLATEDETTERPLLTAEDGSKLVFEDLKEEETHGGLWMSDYRTTKHIIVRSAYLAIPQKLLYIAAVFYISLYQVLWKLSFLDRVPVVANVMSHVEQASADFFSCSSVDRNCKDTFRPLTDFKYCNDSNHPSDFGPCRYYGIHEVQPITYEQAFFVATSFTHISQKRCSGPMHFSNGTQRCASLWNNLAHERHFVAGSEDFQIIFKHSVSTQSQKYVWSGEELPATVIDTSGESLLPCIGSLCPALSSSSLEGLSRCGSQTPGPDACFSSDRGDIMSLARLLKMANIDLDQKAFGNTTKRMQGVALRLDIEYENERAFWSWPWGQTVSYSYQARELEFAKQSPFRVSKWHHLTAMRDERVVIVAFGVLILLNPHGHFGTFSLLRFVLLLTSAGALFGLIDVFIKMVLVNIYKISGCSQLRDAYLLFAYFTRDMAASAAKVAKLVAHDGKHFDTNSVGEEVQKKFDDQARQAKRKYWMAPQPREKQERLDCGLLFATMVVVCSFLVGMQVASGVQQ